MSATGSDKVLDRLNALHPKIIDLGLSRVERLLAALGNPERKLPPVIHVAGTNGKGSTIAFLKAMIEGEGKTAHVYTSPHLVRFHERIALNGTPIDEDQLLSVLERCEQANGGENITYFEITTVAALLAFSETPADFVLLETGLGGRMDATNVLDKPALSLITPISRDHMQYLGESIAEIAGEKAGIMKPGVLTLSALQAPTPTGVLEAKSFIDEVPMRFVPPLEGDRKLGLAGGHQRQNAALAAEAARELGLSDRAIQIGLMGAAWPARLQSLPPAAFDLPSGWTVTLDGGHNAAAGQSIADHIESHLKGRPLHVIYGMLNTKESDAFLAPIAPLAGTLTAITIPDTEASLSAEAAAVGHEKAGHAASLEDALARLPKDQLSHVLIIGSLYLAGYVLGKVQDAG